MMKWLESLVRCIFFDGSDCEKKSFIYNRAHQGLASAKLAQKSLSFRNYCAQPRFFSDDSLTYVDTSLRLSANLKKPHHVQR